MRNATYAIIAMAGFSLAGPLSGARADEVTTTTTTRTTDAPANNGVTIGVPGVVGVQIGGGHSADCTTQKTTTTNDDTGDSVTRKTTDCN